MEIVVDTWNTLLHLGHWAATGVSMVDHHQLIATNTIEHVGRCLVYEDHKYPLTSVWHFRIPAWEERICTSSVIVSIKDCGDGRPSLSRCREGLSSSGLPSLPWPFIGWWRLRHRYGSSRWWINFAERSCGRRTRPLRWENAWLDGAMFVGWGSLAAWVFIIIL